MFRNFLESDATEVWYHGSPVKFDSFRLGKYKRDMQLGFGIHFAKNIDFAQNYGRFIYTCNLFPTKTLDETQIYDIGGPMQGFVDDLHKGTRKRIISDGGKFVIRLDVTNPKRAHAILLKHGYDSVLYEAKYGSAAIGGMWMSNKSVSMVMLDPAKIKILSIDDHSNAG